MKRIFLWVGPNVQSKVTLADGWLLAECTLVDGVVYGGTDGTSLGRKYFDIISKAVLNGECYQSVVEDEEFDE